MAKILIVDDDQGVREMLEIMLAGRAIRSVCSSTRQGTEPLSQNRLRSRHHRPENAED